jgi:hypothetical protein
VKEIALGIFIFSLIFILFALPSKSQGETTLKHGYDEIDMFHACSYYTLQDFDKLESLTADTLIIDSKNEIIGKLENQKVEWLISEPYNETVKTKVPYVFENCIKSNESVSRSYTKPESDTLLEVTLNVVIDKDQKFYILEETPPKEWKVIDSGGMILDTEGILKVVVMSGAKNTTYTYILEVPHELGEYRFDGVYQIEGMIEKRDIGQDVCEMISSYKWDETIVTKTREKYIDISDYASKYAITSGMRSQKVQWVRICSDIKREWTKNGYEVSVDIIPRFDGITYDKLNWWNSSWSYCRNITIENNNATDILYANWTVNISIDSTNSNKFRSDCNDIRIIYYDLELDRYMTGCNTTDTQVWLQQQEDIAVSSNSSGYKVCYGNPFATAGPKDKFKVFTNVPETLINNVVIADFFEDSNVMYINDSSPYGNNGTEVTAGGKQKVSGLFGESINFSAGNNEDYDIPYSTTFDTGTGGFAISMWTYYDSNLIVFDSRRPSDEHGMIFMIATGTFYFFEDGSGSGIIPCQTSGFVQSGVWYHVIVTGDESKCAIYVDGKNLVNGTGTVQGDLFPSTDNSIHLGGRMDAATGTDYKGRIENFLFLNQTITEADADKMYWLTNGQATPPTYLSSEVVGIIPIYELNITVTSPLNTTYYSIHNRWLSVSANMTVHTWWYNLNNEGNITFTPNITFLPSNGTNIMAVYANTSEGNISSRVVWFTVDAETSPPNVTIVSPTNKTYSTPTIPLDVSYNKTINATWYSLTTFGLSSSFSKQKILTVDKSDDMNLTDYQLPINITYEPDMLANFSDIRFFQNCSNETDYLPYCLGSDCETDWTNNKTATISESNYAEGFIRLPNINGTYCMKYGNPTLDYKGNPSSVFSFFDTFNGNILNQSEWAVNVRGTENDSFSVSNGKLVGTAGAPWKHLISNHNGSLDKLRETWVITPEATAECMVLAFATVTAEYPAVDFVDINLCPDECPAHNSTIALMTWRATAYLFENVRWYPNKEYAYREYITNTTNIYGSSSFGQVNASKMYGEYNGTSLNDTYISVWVYSGTWRWHFIRERNYHEPEPTYFFGDEMHSGNIYVINQSFTPNTTINVSEGQSYLIVWANDSSENYGFDEVYFTYNSSYEEEIPIQIINVEFPTSINPIEGSLAPARINFTAEATSIDNSTAKVSLTKGTKTYQNTSCDYQAITGNSVKYFCWIDIPYYEESGIWNINASISTMSGNLTYNDTENITYNELKAFTVNTSTINFSTFYLYEDEKTDSILLNNTGNVNITEINVTAYDLIGQTNLTYTLSSSYYSIKYEGGSYEYLANATAKTIPSANLYTYPADTMDIIFRLEPILIPKNTISQIYQNNVGEEWVISV